MPVSPHLTTLTALAQALSRPADLGRSLDAALATVADALGVETGWVWLLDDDSEEPRLAAARALPPALLEHPDAMHGDCYCLSTFRAGDLRGAANVNVVWCSRLAKVVETSGSGDPIAGLRCHASVPLTVGERRLGMLNVASRDWRVLAEDELGLLTTAGALVSLAVERSRLEAVEERNRLGREIHDTLAQSLAGLTLQLEVADALVSAPGDQRLGEAVTRALGLARSTLDEARRSVLDLRAGPLRGRSLPAALQQLAADTRGGMENELEVAVSLQGFEKAGQDVPHAVEVGLYRIAQQALANVSRHARASRASLRLTRDPMGVRLRVEDDGVGFDPGAVPPDHYGLVGMGERAKLLGGTLLVESAPGRGTAIETVIPLGSRSA